MCKLGGGNDGKREEEERKGGEEAGQEFLFLQRVTCRVTPKSNEMGSKIIQSRVRPVKYMCVTPR